MIGVVFPGQGSQRMGMAKDFYTEYGIAKRTFEEASETLAMDMTALCFEEDDKLGLTEYTQPAILTAEIAMYRSLCETYGLEVDYFGGHSLGEYTALVASDAIKFGAALQIVRKRGALMQRACPFGEGAMAALLHEDIEKLNYKEIILSHDVELANLNSKGQLVISAYRNKIEEALEAFGREMPEIRTVLLEVSAPFHSSIMKKIEGEFAAYLEGFASDFDAERSSRVLSNYTGDFHTADAMQQNLVKQISATVLWVDNMRCLIAMAEKIYEIGPNRPLTAFFATLDLNISPIISVRSAKKIFA